MLARSRWKKVNFNHQGANAAHFSITVLPFGQRRQVFSPTESDYNEKWESKSSKIAPEIYPIIWDNKYLVEEDPFFPTAKSFAR